MYVRKTIIDITQSFPELCLSRHNSIQQLFDWVSFKRVGFYKYQLTQILDFYKLNTLQLKQNSLQEKK